MSEKEKNEVRYKDLRYLSEGAQTDRTRIQYFYVGGWWLGSGIGWRENIGDVSVKLRVEILS